jgi:four helix bundle protein
VRDHRGLLVWRKAHALALDIRRAVSRFPNKGYSELRNQLTSAAESIAINIVEGSGASSQREFARYLDIAVKSAKELEGELELATDYSLLSRDEYNRLTTDTIDTRRMLFGLRKRVLESS